VVASIAALLAALVVYRGRARAVPALTLGVVALFALAYLARLPDWTQPVGRPVTIALLQGNVPQQIKWLDEFRAKTLVDYRRMIFEARAQVVIVPETALPAFLDQLPPDYVASLRDQARATGKEILLGTVERDGRGHDADYYNSLVRLTGERVQSYRKRHLVPFGEYIPPGFGWVLAILHIPMGDFARGAEHQPPLAAGGTTFGVAICYEDVYGEEMIEQLPAAQILVNVSNMAWFGDSFAPEQQLQESQMRSLETGRWMVRATNTGATAAIDDTGHVVARLVNFTTGTLVWTVIPREGSTPYSRGGNAPVLLAAVALAIAARFAGSPRRG
jgi:apolipoprotein N-acyltransferase